VKDSNKIDPEFLKVLGCPVCRSGLSEINNGDRLLCSNCQKTYPVFEGIPVLLPGEGKAV
jgi:uncharacterized protein